MVGVGGGWSIHPQYLLKNGFFVETQKFVVTCPYNQLFFYCVEIKRFVVTCGYNEMLLLYENTKVVNLSTNSASS